MQFIEGGTTKTITRNDIELQNMLDTTSDDNLSYENVINNISLHRLHIHKEELIKLIEDSRITFNEAIDWIEFINTKGVWEWEADKFKGTLEQKLTEIKSKEWFLNTLGFWYSI